MTSTPQITKPDEVLDDSDRGAEDAPFELASGLTLTDFLDTGSLQEIQDAFTSVTHLVTRIRDADGQPVASPTDTQRQAESGRALQHLLVGEEDAQGRLTAPIMVEGQNLGSIEIERRLAASEHTTAHEHARLRQLALTHGVNEDQLEAILSATEQIHASKRGAAIQLLYLMANALARQCYDNYYAKRRVEELSALYRVSNQLSTQGDLQQVLDTAVRTVAEVMQVTGVSIRMFEGRHRQGELVLRAWYNLSEAWINKGPVKLEDSPMYRQALSGDGQVIYIEDVRNDDRVLYPEEAEQEGFRSMLAAGMLYHGKAVGTVQLLTAEFRRFTNFERDLLWAITQLLASAIETAKLEGERKRNQTMIRQVHLAADVQRRMLPGKMPQVPPFDIAARYVPSTELGGDFYDFIPLQGNLGVAIGDVVGKGVAASLLMASVRASLRAYAQDLYDLDQVISRVNRALTSDTSDNEFATLWYGALDPTTLRMTYCNAGHEPPLLLRDGRVHSLDTGGMLVGIDGDQHYDKGVWDLRPADLLLLYTDGLPDAMDPDSNRFGRTRINQLLQEAADQTAAGALNHILWAMRKHTARRQFNDDTSLLTIKVSEAIGSGVS